ncbi:hypothetical protein [Castellaniella sp. S9]|uniref:hypothetical protein n=1 Tax=Castellaniella sp. S9 TaxID=2993652 RepID=UPI0022B583DF|nr:hypothetical protein [Castellaniella sp. S9]
MGVSLTDYADALAAKLREKLSDVPTIEADRPGRHQRSIKLPAIYLEIEDFTSLLEAGDSRLLTDVRWQAHCLVDPNADRAELQLRAFCARVAVALHEIRRPVAGHGHIRLIQASEDPFRPQVDGYLTWAVEFGIEIALGELEPPGIRPTQIMLGQAPAIGAGHADDYERIA